MNRRLFLRGLLGAALTASLGIGSLLAFPRQVTLQDPAKADLESVYIVFDPVGDAQLTVTYTLKDDSGDPQFSGSIDLTLTAGQEAQLNGIVNSTILPAIRAKHGL